MKDRIKTLLVYANGGHWKEVLAETVVRGIFRFQGEQIMPMTWSQPDLITKILRRDRYEALSYVNDWMDAFCEATALDVETCNISNMVEYRTYQRAIKEYPLIIVLHSATGDNMWMLKHRTSWFQQRKGKLLVLVGNEYNLMADKIGFIRSVEADFVGSQLPLNAAQWLYAECKHTSVLATPHALNPKVYRPSTQAGRPVDIGFIGAVYPYSIGDIERSNLLLHLEEHGETLGLKCHIRNERIPRDQWATFLTQCKGIAGAESGTYFLERNSETFDAVTAYLKTRPNATFDEIDEKFYRNRPYSISGKAISSRHFEPIGTQTCQLLVEGHYNGILKADEHYIAVRKDLSNIQDAAECLMDATYRQEMVQRTYDYVMASHTYAHRVRDILSIILNS